MTIGTGIFLSALFIGFVALVIGTRDRWKWGRILARTAIGIVVLLALGCAGFYGYHLYSERPIRQMELWGIKLGDTEADVTFKKGAPANAKDESWIYDGSDYTDKYWVLVSFDYGKVTSVEIRARGGPSSLPYVQRVSGSWTVDDVSKKFGKPSLISTSADETSRILSFRDFNLAFEFEKNAVTSIMIFEGVLKPGLHYLPIPVPEQKP